MFVILTPNSAARTDAVFLNCGCVISIMIAAMTRMNRPTCVANATVPLAGRDVQDNRITVAFPNGCSVMVKTIVAITVMNCQRIVPHVMRKRTSSVATIDVYPSKFNK